jgi:phosphoribosylanthranilate isomerase
VQLNFHAHQHLLAPNFVDAAKRRYREQRWQVIFQCDGVNDQLVGIARDAGLDAVPLYDKSGGVGVVPDKWPSAMAGIYSGYAGGLGPDNLGNELQAISEAAGEGRFWVDMETRIRTSRVFDLATVRRCLEICAPNVTEER